MGQKDYDQAAIMQMIAEFGKHLHEGSLTPEIWIKLSRTPVPNGRKAALNLLVGDDEITQQLAEDQQVKQRILEMLNDSHRGVVFGALVALMELCNPQAVSKLCEILADDPDERFQTLAAHALGNQEDKRAISVLAKKIKQTNNPTLLAACIRALGEIGDPSILPHLLELKTVQDWEAKWALAIALHQLNCFDCIPLLEELNKDPNLEDEIKTAVQETLENAKEKYAEETKGC